MFHVQVAVTVDTTQLAAVVQRVLDIVVRWWAECWTRLDNLPLHAVNDEMDLQPSSTQGQNSGGNTQTSNSNNDFRARYTQQWSSYRRSASGRRLRKMLLRMLSLWD